MSSDSLNDTRIFSAPHKTVLIITPDGRLEAGEGLSNDEVSRELFKSCSTYFDARMDALERENAELRNKIAALQSDRDYWRGRVNKPLIETRGSYTPSPNMVPFPKPNKF